MKACFCNSGDVTLFGFVNEIRLDPDGWAMIAPLGDFPSEALLPTTDGRLKRQKAIQRITKDTAGTMVAQFHNERAGVKKFLRGCNIYLGHPDMPGLESRYPDKTPKGVFADMEVRANGIYGLPVFTNEGMDLVEGRKLVAGRKVRGFSGRLIDSTPDGEVDGVPVYTPLRIASAGLTPHPHLPVEFFNADDTLASTGADKPNQPMNLKLLALLAALNIKPQFANASSPTEAETEAALDAALGRVQETASTPNLKPALLKLAGQVGIAFANEAALTDPAATLAQVADKVAERDAAATNAAAELAAARMQFANERAARVADALEAALTSGRITAADRPAWEGRLKVEAQFANEHAALRALKPAVKTASITLTRGGREHQIDVTDARARRQFINEAGAEIAAELKLDSVNDAKRIAALVQQRHPALFENVPHVEIKLPGGRK